MPADSPWDAVAEAYGAETVPTLEPFAAEALRRAEVGPGVRVLDVAAGPGTLALLAARAGAVVDAIDSSEAMIERLRVRAGGASVAARVADGTALPYAAGLFDAVFSMFGVVFFSDRGQGLREMRRVLGRGGRAVVASWVPLARVPLLAAMFDAVRGHVPVPPAEGTPPLGDLPTLRAEMEAAGLVDVETTELVHEHSVPSAEHVWASFTRTTAPVVLGRRAMGEQKWSEIDRAARTALARRFGEGPQVVRMIANLGVGRA